MDKADATEKQRALLARLARVHAELGIPTDYATTRGLALQLEADEASLVDVDTTPDGERRIRLTYDAAQAWRTMTAFAAQDGIALQLWSGFRSVERQAELVRRKLAAGIAIADVLNVIAAPGYSEHHTGCAIDISTPGQPPLEENFETTAAFTWLSRRANVFGFRLSYPRTNAAGIAYEPWHWLWRDVRVGAA